VLQYVADVIDEEKAGILEPSDLALQLGETLLGFEICQNEPEVLSLCLKLYPALWKQQLLGPASKSRLRKKNKTASTEDDADASELDEQWEELLNMFTEGLAVIQEGSNILARDRDGKWKDAIVLQIIDVSSSSPSATSSATPDKLYRVKWKTRRETSDLPFLALKLKPSVLSKKEKEEKEEKEAIAAADDDRIDVSTLSARERQELIDRHASERLGIQEKTFLKRNTCEMCERITPLTAHHLRPRTMHSKYLRMGYTQSELNNCAMICRPCHSLLHRLIDEETLAAHYYTVELLMADERIQKWCAYASKQYARDLQHGHTQTMKYRR